MITACLRGLASYARAFAGAFTRDGRRRAPLGARRLLALLAGFPLFLLLQCLHGLGFALDEILFRGYRRVAVTAPVFVAGVPRSGTTFIHRLLSADEAQFTTMRTWEAVLAPSISERYLLKGIGYVDRLVGRPGRRLIDALTRRLAGEFAKVHEVGLWAAEEDYLVLLPAGGCFIAALAFPGFAPFWQLARFDRMPADTRHRLMGYYHACLQKHLYVEGRGRCLLSKNAAFASWVPALRETFPDARILICVREPLGALSSQLSAIEAGLSLFGTGADRQDLACRFQETYAHAYECLARAHQADRDRTAVVDQGRVARTPEPVLRAALTHLGIRTTQALDEALRALRAHAVDAARAHRHDPRDFGLCAESFSPAMRRAYAQLSLAQLSLLDPAACQRGIPLETA